MTTSVRDGIRAFIEHETEFEVCGEAENGLTAIGQARDLKPDLIVMDLALPMLNGVQAASIVKRALPNVKIVASSMYAQELGRAVASASRMDAVLPKSSSLALLVETINRLLRPVTPKPN
jgi:DNA-binding NarL/FixJ family response regulator